MDDENPTAPLPAAHVLIVGALEATDISALAQLHHAGRVGPFVHLDWVGLPELLIESELFGHARDGFDGAFRVKVGALERALGGTLLLESLDALPLHVMARLDRALTLKQASRIGSTHPVYPVDVRIVGTLSKFLGDRCDPVLATLCAHFTMIRTGK